MNNNLFEVKQILVEIARSAGQLIKDAYFGERQDAESKGHISDLLTETDPVVEKHIVEKILDRFPDSKIIGEESSPNKLLDNSPTFIIDPIDGTTNFVHKIPLVAVSIGYVLDKKTLVGVIHNPITNEMYYAIRGYGSFLNDKRIRVNSKVESLQKCLLGSNFPFYNEEKENFKIVKFAEILKITKCHGYRLLGSGPLGMCLLARGSLDIFYESNTNGMSIWDVAAANLIVTEAGGVISDYRGREFEMEKVQFVGCANKKVWKELIEIFEKVHEYDD